MHWRTSATYKLSDISLEYDAGFDEPYTTSICEMYTRLSIGDPVYQGNINPL